MTTKIGGGINNTPQLDLLFDHLITRKTISPMEAYNLYSVRSFHRRMADLRELGVKFKKARKVDNTGRRYVEYQYAGQMQL